MGLDPKNYDTDGDGISDGGNYPCETNNNNKEYFTIELPSLTALTTSIDDYRIILQGGIDGIIEMKLK